MNKIIAAAVLVVSLVSIIGCVVYPVMPQADVDARRTATAAAIPPLPTMDDPVALPTVTATLEPTAEVLATEEAPQVACDIKANVGSSGNIYHMPGGVYYDRVKVDTSQGDFYACTEQEAIDAGFRKSTR